MPAPNHHRTPLLVASLLTLILLSVAAVTNPYNHPPLLQSSNYLGPAADSLLHHRGLDVCFSNRHSGFHCLQGMRMPVAPATLALLYTLFHAHTLLAGLTKSFLFLLPALAAFAIAWRNAQQDRARYAALALCALALLLPPAINLVLNLNFEEAYAYSWIALAFALTLFPTTLPPRTLTITAFAALTITYLTKSSLLLVTAALAIMLAAWLWTHHRKLAITLLAAFACVPLLWGAYQHHATGRFSVGTSLDGVNFYKGNNPWILDRYPPPGLTSLDAFDRQIFAAAPLGAGAWAANDYGRAAAIAYIRTHPADTLRVDLRKAFVFFLRIHRDGGDGTYSPLVEFAYTLGMLLFRIAFLLAAALALAHLRTPRTRRAAVVFLTTALCVALPYLAGFALTRHALLLILPTALYLSRVLTESSSAQSTSANAPA